MVKMLLTSGELEIDLQSALGDSSYVGVMKQLQPYGWWRMNSTGTITDLGSGGNNLTAALTFNTTTGLLTGDSDLAGLFNGTNATCNTTSFAPTASCTLHLWTRWAGVGSTIMELATNDYGGWGPAMMLNSSGQLQLHSSGGQQMSGGPSLYDYRRHMLTCVIDAVNGRRKIYTDGVLVGDLAVSQYDVLARLYIGSGKGATDNMSYYGGVIDEPAYWQRALSGTEIARLYQAGTRQRLPGGYGYSIEAGTLTGLGAEHIKPLYTEAVGRVGDPPFGFDVQNRVLRLRVNFRGRSQREVERLKSGLEEMLLRATRWWLGSQQGAPVKLTFAAADKDAPDNVCKVYGGQLVPGALQNIGLANKWEMSADLMLVVEPYWTDEVVTIVHNIQSNPNGEVGTSGWTISIGSMTVDTSGGWVGPTRFVSNNSGVLYALGTGVSVQAGDVIAADGWRTAGDIELAKYNGSSWSNTGSLTEVTAGSEHVATSYTVESGITQVRLNLNANYSGKPVYFGGLRLRKNAGTNVPDVLTGNTVVTQGSVGGTANSRPGEESGFWAIIPAGTSDEAAVMGLRAQPITNGAGTPMISRLIIGKNGDIADWFDRYGLLDQAIAGYTAGSNTSTITGAGTRYMGGSYLKWQPGTTSIVTEEVARWDLSTLYGSQWSQPVGRVAVYAACRYYTTATPQAGFKLGVVVQIGGSSYEVERYVPMQVEANSSDPCRLIYLGEVDLAGDRLPSGWNAALARSLVISGQTSATGWTGQYLELDYIQLMPVEQTVEAQSEVGMGPTYVGEAVIYNVTLGEPEYTVYYELSYPTRVKAMWTNRGGGLSLAPGRAEWVAVAFSKAGGQLENGKAVLTELQYRNRRIMPAGSFEVL